MACFDRVPVDDAMRFAQHVLVPHCGVNRGIPLITPSSYLVFLLAVTEQVSFQWYAQQSTATGDNRLGTAA